MLKKLNIFRIHPTNHSGTLDGTNFPSRDFPQAFKGERKPMTPTDLLMSVAFSNKGAVCFIYN